MGRVDGERNGILEKSGTGSAVLFVRHCSSVVSDSLIPNGTTNGVGFSVTPNFESRSIDRTDAADGVALSMLHLLLHTSNYFYTGISWNTSPQIPDGLGCPITF